MIIRDLFFESGSTEAAKIKKILQRYVIYISKHKVTILVIFIHHTFNTFRSIQCEQFKEKLSEIRGWGQADRCYITVYKLSRQKMFGLVHI
jgi:ASC-1-like (ASCH) protein